MSFNHIILKMAYANIQQYIFYFVCNVIMVLLFFLFMIIYYNEAFVDYRNYTDPSYAILGMPVIVFLVFSVFFIYYAHFIFMKRREKEFAMLQMIGMTRWELAKIMGIENSIVACLSLIVGIVSGTVISRLFFMLFIKIAHLELLTYHLTFTMFSRTIIVFVVIFIISNIISIIRIIKGTFMERLSTEARIERNNIIHPVMALIGPILIIFSLTGLAVTYKTQDSLLLVWMMLTVAGVIFFMLQTLNYMLEKWQGTIVYYKQILLWNRLIAKYKQFAFVQLIAILMIMVSILYTIIVLLNTTLEAQKVQEDNPYDIAILSQTPLKISDPSIIKQQQIRLFSFSALNTKIMSTSDFSAILNEKVTLAHNEYFIVSNQDESQELNSQWKQIEGYIFKEKFNKRLLNWELGIQEYLVMNEDSIPINSSISYVQLITTAHWQASQPLISKIHYHAPNIIAAKKITNESFRYGDGILNILAGMISSLLGVGSFILLYLTSFSDTAKDIAYYKQLLQIGMTMSEYQKMLKQQLLLLYSFPLVVGLTLACVYYIILSGDVKPQLLVTTQIYYIVFTVLIYGIVQYIMYRLTYYKWRRILLHVM